MNVIDISLGQLFISLVFVVLAGVASIRLHLKLERDILWGTIRTFVQLFLIGYILRFVFAINNVFLVILVFSGMIVFSAFIVRGRIKEQRVSYFLPTFVSMFISYTLVTVMVTAVIVQVEPWYEPRYFIPIGGMVIGNSMTAIALSLERILADVRKQRDQIEMFLSLGATHKEATEDVFQESIKAGMIPSISSMMAVGIVFLPGMMTGQILAGADPVTSIKYQIVVMLMLVGSTALSSILAIYVVRELFFNKAEQLRL